MYFSFWGSNPIQPIKIFQQNMHLFYGYWRTVTFTFGTTRWPQNRRLWSGIHLAIRSRLSPVERCVLCRRWSFFPFDFLLIVFSVGCTLILVRASPLVTPARLRLGKFLAKWKPGREKHHHFWLCFCVVLPEPDPKVRERTILRGNQWGSARWGSSVSCGFVCFAPSASAETQRTSGAELPGGITVPAWLSPQSKYRLIITKPTYAETFHYGSVSQDTPTHTSGAA